MKYYAVKAGHKIGIFESWTDCQAATTGFSGADFKAFNSQEEAKAYLDNVDVILQKIQEDIRGGNIVAFCDGSFDEPSQRYSFGVLIIDSAMHQHEICGSSRNEKYISANNVAGEILGVINALDWAVSNGYEKIKIYHDYEGLSKWISGEWEVKSEVSKMFVAVYKAKFADLLNVEFEKVKGHSNNKFNNKADELAKRALSDNARVPIKGDSWYSIPYFQPEELQSVIDLMLEEHKEIHNEKIDNTNSVVYKLELAKNKLCVTLFKNGHKSLLVQGSNTILFQIFITYVNELQGVDADQIISSAYRQRIDSGKVSEDVKTICPDFPSNYPDNIKRLIRQSIINLGYYVDCEDFSQYAFPAFRALEGHMKYLFSKAGLIINSKGFDCFNYNTTNKVFNLPPLIITDSTLRAKLEKYYNFYHANRHTIFHFGDIIGSTDSTRIITNKKEVDELIKKCLSYICEE